MTELEAKWLTGSLIVGGSALLFWWQARSNKQSLKQAMESAEAINRRLKNPDFEGLEQAFASSLPSAFRQLYRDYDLVSSEDIECEIPHPIEGTDTCYFAWFEPADLESLEPPWPGGEGLFPFGSDGKGDQYLVDLKGDDPEVIYLCHESGELHGLGVGLREFLASRRKSLGDGRS